ncbi:Squalene epoxidase [Vanrija albida]|uniref:Squalene monooxygenase n=1 Tax=Vanrija albida TaxID=181172 RepID=A0ABR3Q192_9TREE
MTGIPVHAGPSRLTPRPNPDLSPEIVVVGGGVAGCALAYALSHAGRRVLMLERDLSEPDRIVGELLQPGGVVALAQLGMASCLEGIDATPVEGYCVLSGAREVGIPYPDLERHVAGETRPKANGAANGKANGKANGHANGKAAPNGAAATTIGDTEAWPVSCASGRKEGRSFHHGRFIQALRAKVIDESPASVLEGTVRELITDGYTGAVVGVRAAVKQDGADAPAVRDIRAPLTIIADGCFSKFRQQPGSRLPTPILRSHFVGVVLKDVDLPLKYHGTVCLTPSGPVLLYQIGDAAREIRMLVDVKGKLPSVANGDLKKHILDDFLPHLPAALHTAVRTALDTQRLRTMPNSFLPPSMQGTGASPAGAIMVGDAWNMRHPLTGGGMTVAFSDVVLLTKYLSADDELPAGALDRWDVIADRLREWFWARKGLSGTVNVLSIALYDLFGAADDDLAVLREGCFKYFELGGECVAGPVGLLSALTPKPLLLFSHFFAVAFYSIYILFTEGLPTSGKRAAPAWSEVPGLFLFSFKVFYTACVVFLPVMASEFRI